MQFLFFTLPGKHPQESQNFNTDDEGTPTPSAEKSWKLQTYISAKATSLSYVFLNGRGEEPRDREREREGNN